jgi:hypothetical protein
LNWRALIRPLNEITKQAAVSRRVRSTAVGFQGKMLLCDDYNGFSDHGVELGVGEYQVSVAIEAKVDDGCDLGDMI